MSEGAGPTSAPSPDGRPPCPTFERKPGAPFLPGFEPDYAAGDRTTVSVRLLRETDAGRVAVADGTVSFWTEGGDLTTLASSRLAEAAADEFGFANLERPADGTQGDHWIFTAPGQGASHQFASFDGFDQEEIVLPGGIDRRILVLDPFGVPLPNAEVSMYLGCPHSPSVCTGVTAADGVALLGNLPADRREYFWVVAPGVRPGPYDLLPPAAEETCDRILTGVGRSLRGTVADENGAPMPGIVVRQTGYGRGPVAVADEEGRFTLHGIDNSESPIAFLIPGTAFADRPALLVHEFAEDVALRIMLRRDLPAILAERELRHAVDVRAVRHTVFEDGEGSHEYWEEEAHTPVRLTRLSDGLTVAGMTGDAHTEGNSWGVLRVEVPAGTYRITAGGGFSKYAAGSRTADMPPPDAAPVEVRLGAVQPHLVVGAAGEGGEVRIPGDSRRLTAGQALRLPAEVPATVLAGAGDPILPVGPLETTGSEPVRRVLGAPAPPPAAGGAAGVSVTARVIKLLRADGTPLTPEQCPGFTVLADGDEAGALFPGEFIEAAEDGTVRVECGPRGMVLRMSPVSFDAPLVFYPVTFRVGPAGPEEVRLPGGRICGEVRGAEGRPLSAVVYVDAWSFEAEEGRFDVHGLPAGPHVVITGALDHVGEVRRIMLAGDETRILDFVLPAR